MDLSNSGGKWRSVPTFGFASVLPFPTGGEAGGFELLPVDGEREYGGQRQFREKNMPGIGIITNPHSRRNRRYPERMRRLGYMLGQHDTYELTNRIEDVAAVAERFKDNGVEILALNGGDGTNHVTLTTFIKVYGDEPLPKVALLRGGTMNTVSNGVGISGSPPRLLANLVEKYYTRQPFETTQRDIIRVRDESGERYGFIFGNGLVANFLEEYYAAGDPSPVSAAVLMGKGIASLSVKGELIGRLFRPFTAGIELDAEKWKERDYVSVLASTVDQIGLGFRPFIRCQETEGSFHLLAITAGAVDVAMMLPRIRLGLPVKEDKIRSAVSSRAVFRSRESISYTIDGDMHTAQDGEVVLEAGPKIEIIIK
ncbi:MAG: diacylglycerol/lipid kinase family protein [Bradymonadaceae bacterium]